MTAATDYTAMTAAELIDALKAAGIKRIYVGSQYDPSETEVALDDLFLFAADPLGFEANLAGVSKERYVEFYRLERDSRGGQGRVAPRCVATTKRGTRCKNDSLNWYATPRDYWYAVDLGAEYCHLHGGEPG